MENTRFEYSAIVKRPPLKLPGGARLAFWVVVNVEHFDIGAPGHGPGPGPKTVPDVRTYSPLDYGPRVGIWRIMEVLDKHQIRATAAINAEACERYPVIVEEGKKRGWEFLGHGINNSRPLSGLSEAEEREVIRRSLDTVEKAAGQRPRGWRGPSMAETFNTPDILAEEGIRYLSDWYNDDQPYPMKVRKGSLISIPASTGTSDLQAFNGTHFTPEQYCGTVKDAFDTMYREGATQPRVLSLSLHPFVIGLSFRIGYLDEALGYVRGHDSVWFATGAEIADWYYENCMV